MYEMIVPGKYPVQVPPHLAGTVAVSLGRRLAWRILATIIYGTLDVLLTFAPFYLLFIYRMSLDAFNTLNVMTGVMAFAWLAFVILKLVRTGASPLMALTGVRWVRYDSGAPAGWAGLGKLLLQSVIGTLTFGVGSIIICFASMDQMNRTWFDRALGIVPINTNAGRDTYKTPVIPQSQAPLQPVVYPWNATASAAAFLPPVPSVPSVPFAPSAPPSVPSAPPFVPLSAPPAPPAPEPEATQVPWASAASDPVPTPPTQVSAPAATAPSSDYIGSTPWSNSDSDASEGEPAATEQPLSFSPHSSSYSTNQQASDSSLSQDDADDRTQLGVRYDTARVTFDTGVTYPFGGTIVLGRNPLAPASHPTASPVPVDDPQRSVSKTHVALTATREGVLVEDLHSTGGTVVVRADGEETPVLPGAPVHARAGDTVRYGQRSVVIDG